ncbi:VWA domain-containing protein [Haloarcula sp. S1CR25-12]|uniref:VWA domain-containing protein n=1 Tax=Haloarcula saliterrae TaxID=2950534 RepID=A0ABU2FI13_9EURY|nr:VWA domain-containing protein [Haloarcula sp. S1CR25-12]MDS0261475.1 VWA domain-containing protein [Haloarcula sp. S1CR25-12]
MVVFAADKKASQATFESVVGQRDLKDGLLAVAADDGLDGLLIRGEKGTAKSTTVRALADLLPEQRAVADCPYSCPPAAPGRQCSDCREREELPVEERRPPVVTLPLGATRDRLVGTLSVADALAGEAEFDPGLLARANRGILYVDEVNLLDDHLVDVLLDAAASGVNRVERDGVTVSHPAAFTLVGTMNPEEGDLRPQLRDRFALQTEVTACEDIEDRVAIIDRALGDGAGATDDGGETDRSPGERLTTARELLADVALSQAFRERIATLCRDAQIDGHRGDIATARAARTFAALDGRTTVLEPDIERAAEFALPHRLASEPFAAPPDIDDVLDDQFGDGSDDEASGEPDGEPEASESPSDDDGEREESPPEDERSEGDEASDAETDGEAPGQTPAGDGSDGGVEGGDPSGSSAPADAGQDGGNEPGEGGDDASDAGADGSETDEATPLLPGQSPSGVGESASPDVEPPAVDTDGRAASGRASATGTDRGATVRTEPTDGAGAVDAAASVRAAAKRGRDAVGSRDLRQSVRNGDAGTLVVFAVDASASMRPAMDAAKGCVLELLRDAYQARDEVAVVTFAGDDADVVLPPTDSVTLAARHLKELPTGDRTPLPAGLATAAEVVTEAAPDAAVAVVVTDGRANAAEDRPVAATRDAARRLGAVADRTVVVDAGTESRAALTETVAEATEGSVVPLSALSAERIDAAAQQ